MTKMDGRKNEWKNKKMGRLTWGVNELNDTCYFIPVTKYLLPAI
jgi:hypothetical protein